MALVLHRLKALERRVDTGLAHIEDRLDRLSFVSIDSWVTSEKSRDKDFKHLEDKVLQELTETKRISVWALGLVVGLVVTVMGSFLLWIAQGGGG